MFFKELLVVLSLGFSECSPISNFIWTPNPMEAIVSMLPSSTEEYVSMQIVLIRTMMNNGFLRYTDGFSKVTRTQLDDYDVFDIQNSKMHARIEYPVVDYGVLRFIGAVPSPSSDGPIVFSNTKTFLGTRRLQAPLRSVTGAYLPGTAFFSVFGLSLDNFFLSEQNAFFFFPDTVRHPSLSYARDKRVVRATWSNGDLVFHFLVINKIPNIRIISADNSIDFSVNINKIRSVLLLSPEDTFDNADTLYSGILKVLKKMSNPANNRFQALSVDKILNFSESITMAKQVDKTSKNSPSSFLRMASLMSSNDMIPRMVSSNLLQRESNLATSSLTTPCWNANVFVEIRSVNTDTVSYYDVDGTLKTIKSMQSIISSAQHVLRMTYINDRWTPRVVEECFVRDQQTPDSFHRSIVQYPLSHLPKRDQNGLLSSRHFNNAETLSGFVIESKADLRAILDLYKVYTAGFDFVVNIDKLMFPLIISQGEHLGISISTHKPHAIAMSTIWNVMTRTYEVRVKAYKSFVDGIDKGAFHTQSLKSLPKSFAQINGLELAADYLYGVETKRPPRRSTWFTELESRDSSSNFFVDMAKKYKVESYEIFKQNSINSLKPIDENLFRLVGDFEAVLAAFESAMKMALLTPLFDPPKVIAENFRKLPSSKKYLPEEVEKLEKMLASIDVQDSEAKIKTSISTVCEDNTATDTYNKPIVQSRDALSSYVNSLPDYSKQLGNDMLQQLEEHKKKLFLDCSDNSNAFIDPSRIFMDSALTILLDAVTGKLESTFSSSLTECSYFLKAYTEALPLINVSAKLISRTMKGRLGSRNVLDSINKFNSISSQILKQVFTCFPPATLSGETNEDVSIFFSNKQLVDSEKKIAPLVQVHFEENCVASSLDFAYDWDFIQENNELFESMCKEGQFASFNSPVRQFSNDLDPLAVICTSNQNIVNRMNAILKQDVDSSTDTTKQFKVEFKKNTLLKYVEGLFKHFARCSKSIFAFNLNQDAVTILSEHEKPTSPIWEAAKSCSVTQETREMHQTSHMEIKDVFRTESIADPGSRLKTLVNKYEEVLDSIVKFVSLKDVLDNKFIKSVSSVLVVAGSSSNTENLVDKFRGMDMMNVDRTPILSHLKRLQVSFSKLPDCSKFSSILQQITNLESGLRLTSDNQLDECYPKLLDAERMKNAIISIDTARSASRKVNEVLMCAMVKKPKESDKLSKFALFKSIENDLAQFTSLDSKVISDKIQSSKTNWWTYHTNSFLEDYKKLNEQANALMSECYRLKVSFEGQSLIEECSKDESLTLFDNAQKALARGLDNVINKFDLDDADIEKHRPAFELWSKCSSKSSTINHVFMKKSISVLIPNDFSTRGINHIIDAALLKGLTSSYVDLDSSTNAEKILEFRLNRLSSSFKEIVSDLQDSLMESVTEDKKSNLAKIMLQRVNNLYDSGLKIENPLVLTRSASDTTTSLINDMTDAIKGRSKSLTSLKGKLTAILNGISFSNSLVATPTSDSDFIPVADKDIDTTSKSPSATSATGFFVIPNVRLIALEKKIASVDQVQDELLAHRNTYKFFYDALDSFKYKYTLDFFKTLIEAYSKMNKLNDLYGEMSLARQTEKIWDALNEINAQKLKLLARAPKKESAENYEEMEKKRQNDEKGKIDDDKARERREREQKEAEEYEERRKKEKEEQEKNDEGDFGPNIDGFVYDTTDHTHIRQLKDTESLAGLEMREAEKAKDRIKSAIKDNENRMSTPKKSIEEIELWFSEQKDLPIDVKNFYKQNQAKIISKFEVPLSSSELMSEYIEDAEHMYKSMQVMFETIFKDEAERWKKQIAAEKAEEARKKQIKDKNAQNRQMQWWAWVIVGFLGLFAFLCVFSSFYMLILNMRRSEKSSQSFQSSNQQSESDDAMTEKALQSQATHNIKLGGGAKSTMPLVIDDFDFDEPLLPKATAASSKYDASSIASPPILPASPPPMKNSISIPQQLSRRDLTSESSKKFEFNKKEATESKVEKEFVPASLPTDIIEDVNLPSAIKEEPIKAVSSNNVVDNTPIASKTNNKKAAYKPKSKKNYAPEDLDF